MKTLENLEKFYTNLQSSNEFEGYIHMSDEKLNKIYTTKQKLPSWEDIHNDKNFIYEACFFDGDRSITIRQVNDQYLVLDKKLSNFNKTTEELFESKTDKKIKIIQVWEEKEDDNCLSIKVLKPSLQLFSGFVGGNL